MRQTISYNVIDHTKYKKIEIVPIFDTSGYKIYIDGVVRYGEVLFTKSEIDEKVEYYRRNMKIEQHFVDGASKYRKTDEEFFEDKGARDVEEMKKVIDEALPKIKRGRGRPKKVASTVLFDEVINDPSIDSSKWVETQPKRGRGRPKGSLNKPKE